jgi:hypothetical protein
MSAAWFSSVRTPLSNVAAASVGRFLVQPRTPPFNLVYYTSQDNQLQFAHRWTHPATQVPVGGTIQIPMALTVTRCPQQGGRCVGGWGWTLVAGAQSSNDCVRYDDDSYLASTGRDTHVNAALLQSTTTASFRFTPFNAAAPCLKVFLLTYNGGTEGGTIATYWYTRVGHQHLPPPVPSLLSPPNGARVNGASGIPLVWSANGSTTYRYDYYLIIYQYNFTSRQYQLYYQGYQPSGVTLPKGLKGYFAWQVFAVDHTYGNITGHYSGSPFSYFTAQ